MNERHPSEYSSDHDAHTYGACPQGSYPATGTAYANHATGSTYAHVPQQAPPYDQAYAYGYAPGYGQAGTGWETGVQPALDPFAQGGTFAGQSGHQATGASFDTGTYDAAALWQGGRAPGQDWDSGGYPAYGYGTAADTGSYQQVPGYPAGPAAGYDTPGYEFGYELGGQESTAYGTGYVPAAYGMSDTGTFDTTAFPTGTYDTGPYDTGTYATTAFPTGTYDTGTLDTGTYDTAAFATGPYDTGAYDTGMVATGASGTAAFGTPGFGTAGFAAQGFASPVPGGQDTHGPAATGVLDPVDLLDDPADDVFGAGDPGDDDEVRHDFAPDGQQAPGSRRRGGRRSTLLGVAVPSVAVLGVAAVGAAAIGGVGMAQDSSSNTSADGAAKAPTTQLDRQLSGVSQDADDFATRANRSQERVDLKDRQEAAKRAAAAAAARKEALRPKFVLPVKQKGLSAYFGQSGEHWMALHTGIDFPVQVGTPVMAVTDGTVRTQWNSSYGNMAIVTAPDGTETWYCHLSSTKIRSGKVKAGTVIAYSGNTGNTTGPHLHLEVRPHGGAPIDPLKWLLAHGLDPR